MDCPKCGGERVDHEGPGPGQGGLFRFRCRDCGHEGGGIADPGGPLPDVEAGEPGEPMPKGGDEVGEPEVPRRSEEVVEAPCSVCGKPGRVHNLPGGVPVSDSFCDEHVPTHTLKPLSCLLVLVALGVLGIIFWWLAP